MFTTLEEAITHYDTSGGLDGVLGFMARENWKYFGVKSMTKGDLVDTIRELGGHCMDETTKSCRSGGWIVERLRNVEGTGLDSWNLYFDVLGHFSLQRGKAASE